MASAFTGTPHEVLPGESCIFCAEKHLSSAYVEVMRKGHLTGTLIGDLELARRHTVYEYPRVADKIAELLVLASSRMLDGWTAAGGAGSRDSDGEWREPGHIRSG